MQKIVFFGSGDFTIPVVQKLLTHGLDLVITNDKNPNSQLVNFCNKNNVTVLLASSSAEILNQKSKIQDHDIAILASYGAFIPDEIIHMFPDGIINIHPSLLPKYKGPSPIQYALLNGETITGVTLIKLDSEIDHGPILSQKPYNLTGNETSEDLLSILFEIGADMVEELVLKFENNETITETPQDHTKESWSYKIEKKDGMIDLSSPEVGTENWKLKTKRIIRALYPWPGVWLRYSTPVIAGSETTRQSSLENKIIKFLPENKIQVEGKIPMDYKDFINGYGDEGRELLEKLLLL